MKSQNFIFSLLIALSLAVVSCTTAKVSVPGNEQEEVIKKNFGTQGPEFLFSFVKGKAHNHPTFAIWLESPDGELIQTLFVTRSIANGFYRYGDAGDGKWLKVPGKSVRPAALPYWVHKREGVSTEKVMPTPEDPVADAFSGATPAGNFRLETLPKSLSFGKLRVVVEVNQPWDWNRFWTNDKYPDFPDYKSSAQPSLIYAVDVNLDAPMDVYHLNPVGHGAFAGQDGNLYTDLSGYTTALQIFNQITLTIRK